jgi:tetratricopeptide (TPR) repeat protein
MIFVSLNVFADTASKMEKAAEYEKQGDLISAYKIYNGLYFEVDDYEILDSKIDQLTSQMRKSEFTDKFTDYDEIVDAADFIKGIGLYQVAEKLYSKADKMKPADSETTLESAKNLFWNGKEDDALNKLKELLSNEPNNLQAIYRLASFNLKRENYLESAKYFDKLFTYDLSFDVFNSLTLFDEAILVYTKTDGPIKKQEILHKAIIKLPNHTDYYLQLGLAYLDTEQFEDAKSWFKKAAELEPECLDASYYIALSDYQLDNDFSAEYGFEKLNEKNPNYKDTNLYLGILYFNYSHKYRDAEICFTKYLENHPDHIEALIYRTLLNYQLENYSTALKDVDRYLELKPDDGEAKQMKQMILEQINN